MGKILGKHWKKKYQIAFFIIIMLLTALLSIHFFWMDGIVGALAEITIGNTVYSDLYSEWKFRNISVGSSEKDAIVLLGEPVKKIKNNGRVSFCYTTWGKSALDNSGADCCYTDRILIIENGIVVEKRHGFNID